MVLQRDMPLRVWGRADAGERISVSLNGVGAITIADATGAWRVVLPAMPAGGPFTLTVAGKTALAVHDVMIGEVWIASGQSNMTFPVIRSTGGETALEQADRPDIRLFTAPKRSTLEPQQTLSSTWMPCNRDTAREFSAVAYYFAADLSRALHVPIGIILASWEGTGAEEWTAPGSLDTSPDLQPIVNRWRNEARAVRDFAQDGNSFDLWFDDFQLVPANGAHEPPRTLAGFDDGQGRTTDGGYFAASSNSSLELAQPGYDGSRYAAHFTGTTTLAITPWLRAVLRTNDSGAAVPDDLSRYDGLRFSVRGKGCFHSHLEIPAINDGDNYASTVVCATENWQTVTVMFKDLHRRGWGVKSPLTRDRISAFVIDVNAGANGEGQRPPSGLFNGMIAPLAGYGIRGVIWYQGENNVGRAYQYRALLPAMMASWRHAWGEGAFPFLIVQLPNMGQPQSGEEESNWAELREAQLLSSETLHAVKIAVTIDLGGNGILHPPAKAEVAQRLSLVALGSVYGHAIVYSGPVFESMETRQSAICLHFTNAEKLAAKGGGELQGFAVAGGDKKFVPARAIIQNKSIFVSSPLVPKPVAVRYAWAGNPMCNLINGAGLPASPFRTDHWPVSTQNER